MTTTAYRIDKPLLTENSTRYGALCHNSVEDLAFAHWQYNANERAYANKLITQTMYEYARDKLRKTIDKLSILCYSKAL